MSRCECPKEATSQSEHSPGLVKDEEPIVYALVDPLTSKDGSVKDFSKSQLKSGTLSVCRAAHCTAVEAQECILDPLLSKPDRKFEGAVWARCESIRGIKLGSSEVGAFCVHDDALENYAAHAHLAFSSPEDEKLRNEREAARGNLKEIFLNGSIFGSLSDCPFRSTIDMVAPPSSLEPPIAVNSEEMPSIKLSGSAAPEKT